MKESSDMADDDVQTALMTLQELGHSYETATVQTVYGPVSAFLVRGYWIHLTRTGIWAGIQDSKQQSLGFTIASGGHAAGRIVAVENELWLCHTGHLGGNQRPVAMNTLLRAVQVQGRFEVLPPPEDAAPLIWICEVSQLDALERISEFARQCDLVRASLYPEPIPGQDGSDLGPAKGGERRSCIFSARHHPVTKALRKELIALGWNPKQPSLHLRPDLYMTRDINALFEVKPDAGLHNAMTAIGQLLVYSQANPSDKKVMIIPELSPAVTRFVSPAAEQAGLEMRFYAGNGNDEFEFYDLASL